MLMWPDMKESTAAGRWGGEGKVGSGNSPTHRVCNYEAEDGRRNYFGAGW